MKTFLWVSLSVLAVLIGLGFILPAMAKLHSYRLDFIEQPLWMGMALTCAGVGLGTCGLRRRRS